MSYSDFNYRARCFFLQHRVHQRVFQADSKKKQAENSRNSKMKGGRYVMRRNLLIRGEIYFFFAVTSPATCKFDSVSQLIPFSASSSSWVANMCIYGGDTGGCGIFKVASSSRLLFLALGTGSDQDFRIETSQASFYSYTQHSS